MRVILADHHLQARRALVELLEEKQGFIVTGEAVDTHSLLELAEKQPPADVILLDYELPGLALAELINQIHSLEQPPKVIVISSDPEHARIALNAGAEAFVSKGDQPTWLFASLQRFERN
jgi:DNA-binding NarL/FixJ family response regulator